MASFAQPAPPVPTTLGRFFAFVRGELQPQARTWPVLLRVVLTVVITFVLVATFRMPYAAITLYSVFTIERSSRRASVMRAIESIVAVTAGVAMGLVGVAVFADIPMLMFIYYACEIFAVAFLLRTARLPGPAMNMGLAVYSVYNTWERPYPAGPHIEQTLWVWLTLCLGFVVAVCVEMILVREKPIEQIAADLNERLVSLSSFLRSLAHRSAGLPQQKQAVARYALMSTAGIRARINAMRQTDLTVSEHAASLTAVTALIGRLIDVSAAIDTEQRISDRDVARLTALAEELDRLAEVLRSTRPFSGDGYAPTMSPSDGVPSLPELERTATHIPAAMTASEAVAIDPVAAEVLDPEERLQIFVPDAFENRGYLLFALKTTIAAMLCYVVYSALSWPGLGTSVVTCLVTATNTIGATRQKQILRLAGASCGGMIAIASLVFLIPEIDSITAMAVLVAAVSAFSARIALASPRISYFGLQTALAFYLAALQGYGASTELAPARDRILGVLLGSAMMWVVFDSLWPVSAAEHMVKGLARNLRLLAQLVTALDQPNRSSAIRSIRDIRDRLQQGFAAVHGYADSVLFEFGAGGRRQHLALRECILRWQATVRTVFVVEVAICQYRTQVVPGTRPSTVREAQRDFDHRLAEALQELANRLENRGNAEYTPPLAEALIHLQSVALSWADTISDEWICARVQGILSLSKQLTGMVEQLSRELKPTSV